MDKDRFKGVSEKIGWEVVLIVLAVMLSPIISSMVITPLYVTIGMPGYGSPNLDVSVEQVNTIYTSGTTVQRFDNLTWESGHSLYQVKMTHEGGPVVERAVFEVRFPGCLRGSKMVRPSPGSSPITVSSPLDPTIETTGQPRGDVVGCTIQIITESIHRHEGYTFDFVIDHQPDYCDMLVAYNPSEKFLVEYSWYESGQLIRERTIGNVRGANQAYENIGLHPNSTLIAEKGDGFQVYIVGEGQGNATKANQICYGK